MNVDQPWADTMLGRHKDMYDRLCPQGITF